MVSVLSCVLVLYLISAGFSEYQPTWPSLDSRPLPAWYDESKLGIFIHWGVFSVPSFYSEWFWYYWREGREKTVRFMAENYKPGWTYADFAAEFTAEFFDATQWAELFKASGARYVVLTSKHHEGFCNWPTKVSFNWNSMDVGPKRDTVGELAAAIRSRTDIHFGLYHSMFEWFNPLYLKDRQTNFSTDYFVKEKPIPELYELVNRYKPEVIWSDGVKEAPDTYWKSREFIAWLYNKSPVKDTVVINDRWGSQTLCRHGGFLTCKDRYNPGKLQKRKWENAMTIDKHSWGYRREATLKDMMNMTELVTMFVTTVSCGGNMLVNVGPTKSGRIIPFFEERLRQLGGWLAVNGEAIYSSKPWTHQNDTVTGTVWYTSKKGAASTTVYAISLMWPRSSLVLGAPRVSVDTKVTLLGYHGNISYKKHVSGGIELEIPFIYMDDMPCQWAWTFKITNIVN
ncbi:alpha-L-fucosidase-like [Gigantopelta aegis]|uniref:alpha-L-fucosidase-like n=1 Tax=Gigantopelta aegis TaxID=1735272 RepID=UPI001B88BA44|nr:alpha-L-fucosidase-like [Gigantopelta aegis]